MVFSRLREWLGRRPLFVDTLWALVVMLISALSAPDFTGPAAGIFPSRTTYALLTLGLTVPLIWRRKHPRAVFALISLISFGQWLADVEPLTPNMAVLVGLYAVASTCALRWTLAAAAVSELGMLLISVADTWRDLEQSKSAVLTSLVFVVGITISGIYTRTRRDYLHSLEDRALRAERERDTQVQIAMAAERARIARELHDVIAHNVSVIVVQADGAAYAIESDVDRARRALETISTTGRLALSEMRRLLGVLREGDDAGTYTPQPGVGQLAELVEQVREAGLPLEFSMEGTPRDLPPGLQLAAYRIVQEALTNTLKHAGPGASARVQVHFGDDEVRISACDDGRGSAAWLMEGTASSGTGHGLPGMRERAALYEGSVQAGPMAGGGFEVLARLPIPAEPMPAEPAGSGTSLIGGEIRKPADGGHTGHGFSGSEPSDGGPNETIREVAR